MRLKADKVIEAREKEMQYVRGMKVWAQIPRRQAQARGWAIIKTRWIDMNKGDDENPSIQADYLERSSTTKPWMAYSLELLRSRHYAM